VGALNCAVGKEAPPWLCIESMHFSTTLPESERYLDKAEKVERDRPSEPTCEYITTVEAARLFRRGKKTLSKAATDGRIRVVPSKRKGDRLLSVEDIIRVFGRNDNAV